jgi:hypothetical protein
MKFFCVKEKKNVEVADYKPITYGKRNAITGVCPTCGTKVVKFVAKSD